MTDQTASAKETYFFDRFAHHVADDGHPFSLVEAQEPSNRLVLNCGVPLWLEDVDAICNGQTVQPFR